MNLSADEVAVVPAVVVSVISTAPGEPATGEVATHVVAEEQTTELADTPPNRPVVAPGTKPVPLTVTTVPPDSGPLVGVMPVTARALVSVAVVVAEGPPLLDTVMPVKV